MKTTPGIMKTKYNGSKYMMELSSSTAGTVRAARHLHRGHDRGLLRMAGMQPAIT
jgi:hypothetical protein